MQYSLEISLRILNFFFNGANFVNETQNTESIFQGKNILFFYHWKFLCLNEDCI